MYFPKNTEELKTILEDLQHFARLEGMHRLSESLADARFEISRNQTDGGETTLKGKDGGVRS